jgi:hypothetical protein
MCERDSDTESSIAIIKQTSEQCAASNEHDGPTPPTYAHPRYAASDTPGVIWYDPRDNRESFSQDLSTEIDTGERRVTSGKIGSYRPAEFGVPPEQYITKIGVQYGPEQGDEFPFAHSAVSSEVHDSLDAAQAHLAKHVPGYEQAPRRDAVLHRTGYDCAAHNSKEARQ